METLMAILVAMLSGAPVGGVHPHAEPATVTAVQRATSEDHAAQQNSVKACAQKGDEHQKSSGACVTTKKQPKLSVQRERMRACTREAGDKHLKGYDRVEFIASCIDAAGPG